MIEPLCRDRSCRTCRMLREIRHGQIQRRHDLVFGFAVVLGGCLVLALANALTSVIHP